MNGEQLNVVAQDVMGLEENEGSQEGLHTGDLMKLIEGSIGRGYQVRKLYCLETLAVPDHLHPVSKECLGAVDKSRKNCAS